MARIMIPNYPVPDTFVGNVTYTLRQMGHEVITPKKPFMTQRRRVLDVANRFIEKAFPDRLTVAERWALKVVKDYSSIDLLLCMTKSLGEEVLSNLKRNGTRQCAVWWGDTPANIPGDGLMSDQWDAIFIKDAMAVQKLLGVGLPAHLLHEALNPTIHCRNFKEIGNSVAVVGNYYGYRQMLVRRLIEKQIEVDLFGFRPPRWAHQDIVSRYNGRYVVGVEKSEVFGSALASLNCTAMSEGDSLNCRAFEIAGACGLQLIEDKPAISSCFEPDVEVLVYRSVDDIEAHLHKAKADPIHALKVREAGYRRAHSEHTYQHRLNVILGLLGIG